MTPSVFSNDAAYFDEIPKETNNTSKVLFGNHGTIRDFTKSGVIFSIPMKSALLCRVSLWLCNPVLGGSPLLGYTWDR